MKIRFLVTASMVVALAAPARAQLRDGRENPLTAARDLTEHDLRLAYLAAGRTQHAPVRGCRDRIASRSSSTRSLCLLALGRGAEAGGAIAAVVTPTRCSCPAKPMPLRAFARRSAT